MKRGKRQIVDIPNPFGQEQPSQTSSIIEQFPTQFSNNASKSTKSQIIQYAGTHDSSQQQQDSNDFVSTFNNKNQNYESRQNKYNQNKSKNAVNEQPRQQVIKETRQLHKQQNQIITQRQTAVVNSAEDERKKRLQLLKQKYLKSGPSSQSQNIPQKLQQNKPTQQIVIKSNKPAKFQRQRQQQPQSNFSWNSNGLKTNQNKNEGTDFFNQLSNYNQSAVSLKNNQSQNKIQNETPISKPTQQNQNVYTNNRSSSYNQYEQNNEEYRSQPVPVPSPIKNKKIIPPPGSQGRRNNRAPPPPIKPISTYKNSTIEQQQQRQKQLQPEAHQQSQLQSHEPHQPKHQFPLKPVPPVKSKRSTNQNKPKIPTVARPSQEQAYEKQYPQYENGHELNKQSNGQQQQDRFNRLLELWLNGHPPEQPLNNEAIIDKIAQQLSQIVAPGSTSSYPTPLIHNFLLNNSHPYTACQQSLIQQILTNPSNTLSPQCHNLLSLKINHHLYIYTNYQNMASANINFQSNDKQQIEGFLNGILGLADCVLYEEFQMFVSYFRDRGWLFQYMLPILVRIYQHVETNHNNNNNNRTSSLLNYISTQFYQSKDMMARLLYTMKQHQGNNNYWSAYLNVVKQIITHIKSTQALQKIIQQINSIGNQQLYQQKKQTKLRIIQRINNISNQSATSSSSAHQSKYYSQASSNVGFAVNQENQQASQPVQVQVQVQAQQEKTLGMSNIMGFVGQALKKIKSQMPDMQNSNNNSGNANGSSAVEETKQSIVWDPKLGRYLINGKVPKQDKGSVFDSTSANQPKQKKKPPPPPSRSGRQKPPKQQAPTPTFPLTSPQFSNQQSHQSHQIQPFAFAQHQKQQNNLNENGNEQQYQQQNMENKNKNVPRPPPRVGIKGLVGKKPKMQTRYA